jgi:hypothetical protein
MKYKKLIAGVKKLSRYTFGNDYENFEIIGK